MTGGDLLTKDERKMRQARGWKKLCASLAVLFACLSHAHGQERNAGKFGMDAERLARIPVKLKSLVEGGAIVGAVTLVARRGAVVSLEAVGYQDLESKRAMRSDVIFDIRSLTKPITAIGIMILMEEGRLALNDPIEKYLPEFKAQASRADVPSNPVRIRHLLTHTGGYPFYRLPESEQIAIKRDRTLTDYVAFLSKHQPEVAPGTQHRYSSGGFAILGRIIEIVSGVAFEQFMKERIFDPLGMKDTFFYIPADKQSRLASIYRRQNNQLKKWEELMAHARVAKYPGPEFGLYSTASDLFALCQMMLDGGTFKGRRMLSRLSVAEMTRNQTLDIRSAITQRPAFQGLGWGLSGDPVHDFPLTTAGSFGHNGATGTIFWMDPEKRLIRIFLQQLFGSGNEINLFMAMAGAAVVD